MRRENLRKAQASWPLRDARTGGRDGAGGVRGSVPGNGRSALRPRPRWLGGLFPKAGSKDATAWTVPRWGQRASGTGRADGDHLGADRSGGSGGRADATLRFDTQVIPGGYLWWYLDGLSDDGRHGFTIIGFVGSVFSPYYAWARGRGSADPENHVALNVALYGPKRRWAMTERGASALLRSVDRFAVGPSEMEWDGTALTVRFDERSAPLPLRLRGTVRLFPAALFSETFTLDPAGLHRWTPLAASARVEVALEEPSLAWSGYGYLDTNAGDEPLERGFSRWDWARAKAGSEALILYDAWRRDGSRLALSLRPRADGTLERLAMPEAWSLPRTPLWRIRRTAHGEAPRVAATLEDTPFYARSTIATRLLGQEATAVHESLDLDRFSRSWVRALLPFRMPRRP
jgi:carotenoid 1,2-hydratase